jgi:N utilization substance protein A
MSSPIFQAMKQICDEKNIPFEAVLATIESALAAAYNKDFGDKKTQNVKVTFDPETGNFDAFDVKTVVEDQELPTEEELAAIEAEKANQPPAEIQLDEFGNPIIEKKFNPKTEMMISEAKKVKKGAEIGDEIRMQLEVPAAFGRMAAQTAKQVVMQNLREAERGATFNEFKGREHELINATVQRREGKLVLIDLGKATGIMPPEEQIPTERYNSGDRVKVYLVEVRLGMRGPEIIVSRAHREIIRKLFHIEIPEVASGVVEMHSIAREAGSRAKVSVSTTQENVDPIGSCIGQRGTRIQTIINELGGEKVDIIQFDADPAKYIANALSPAKVGKIMLNEPARIADVIVTPDQLSLAIGRGGQNVRLASRLTGWKINIHEKQGSDEVADVVESAPAEESSTKGEQVTDEIIKE